jgi:hypothetical protein
MVLGFGQILDLINPSSGEEKRRRFGVRELGFGELNQC